MRLENFRKMEGMVHPILHRKMSPQNIGAARPIKRSLEDLDLVIAGKKARAVSPLDPAKDASGKEKASEQETEGTKTTYGGHSGGGSEGHKLSLSSPSSQVCILGTCVTRASTPGSQLGTLTLCST